MAMLAGPAYCFEMNDTKKDPLTLKYERDEQVRKDAEQAYNVQMKRLKAQAPAATENDPWSGFCPAGVTLGGANVWRWRRWRPSSCRCC